MDFDPKRPPCVHIVTKRGKDAQVIFYSYDGQKDYIKGENKFCKQAYIDYCSAFTTKARARAKKALDTQRRLFAETKGYAPSKGKSEWWIFHPKLPKARA